MCECQERLRAAGYYCENMYVPIIEYEDFLAQFLMVRRRSNNESIDEGFDLCPPTAKDSGVCAGGIYFPPLGHNECEHLVSPFEAEGGKLNILGKTARPISSTSWCPIHHVCNGRL